MLRNSLEVLLFTENQLFNQNWHKINQKIFTKSWQSDYLDTSVLFTNAFISEFFNDAQNIMCECLLEFQKIKLLNE